MAKQATTSKGPAAEAPTLEPKVVETAVQNAKTGVVLVIWEDERGELNRDNLCESTLLHQVDTFGESDKPHEQRIAKIARLHLEAVREALGSEPSVPGAEATRDDS